MRRSWFHRLTRSASRVFGGRRPSPSRPPAPQVEALEGRWLLNCSPSLVGRIVSTNCDSASDDVAITNLGTMTRVRYSIPGFPGYENRDFANSAYDSMSSDLGDGADLFRLYSVPSGKTVMIQGGRGFNNINLGVRPGEPSSTAGILSPVWIFADSGSNAIRVDNSSDTTSRTVTLDETHPTIGRITGLTVEPILYVYGTTSSLDVRAGSGTHTVNVQNTGAETTVSTSSSSGTVNVGYLGSVQGIRGRLTIEAYARLFVDDSSDAGARSNVNLGWDGQYYGFIRGLAPGEIRYMLNAIDLTIRTGPGGTATTVDGMRTDVTLVGKSPNDTVLARPRLGTLSDVLTVENPTGTTLLTADYSAVSTPQTFGVATDGAPPYLDVITTGTRFEFIVKYRSDEHVGVTLKGGPGGNTFNVGRTGGSRLTLQTGGGNDTVHVGTGFASAGLQGMLRVEGQGGTNRVLFNDQAEALARNYYLSSIHFASTGTPWTLVYYDLAEFTIQAGPGDDTLTLVNGARAGTRTTFQGGFGTNAVIGPGWNHTWTLTDADAGFLDVAGYGTLNFTGVGSVTGREGDDIFTFRDGATLSGVADGGAGRNLLDYSGVQGGVYVLMPFGAASAVGGFTNIQDAVGGQGDNLLVGDDQDNMLFGNDGRDVLLGGWGADGLAPGPGEDLVIGGYTDFDYDYDALAAISSVWSLTDSDYAGRVDLLTAGYEGIPTLNEGTVHDDYAGNQLAGNSGLDWFFAGAADVLEDLEEEERVDYVF